MINRLYSSIDSMHHQFWVFFSKISQCENESENRGFQPNFVQYVLVLLVPRAHGCLSRRLSRGKRVVRRSTCTSRSATSTGRHYCTCTYLYHLCNHRGSGSKTTQLYYGSKTCTVHAGEKTQAVQHLYLLPVVKGDPEIAVYCGQ